jgi:CheY-like chemotaxis protein
MNVIFSQPAPKRVLVVDDDEEGREDLMDSLRDLNFEPLEVTGMFDNRLDDLIAEIEAQNPNFVICDHRLQPKQLAQFPGVDVVKRLVSHKRPAMLLTMFASTDRLALRQSRFQVPVIVERDNFKPARVEEYFEICHREINQNPVDERKPHRSLIRIENVATDRQHIDAVIPSWRPEHAVPIPLECIAPQLHNELSSGAYLLGYINLGATSEDELYFHEVNEFAPAPKELGS